MSGTFIMGFATSHPEYYARLERDIQVFFSYEFGSSGTFLNSGTLLPLNLQPTKEEVDNYCHFSDFSTRNPKVCN